MPGTPYQCFRACVRNASINWYVDVPKRVSQAIRDESKAGRVAVEGLLNTSAFRTTLIPLGDRHRLYLTPRMRRFSDVGVGDMVVVALRPATPGIPAPPDMAAGLRKVKGAAAAFDLLSPTQRGRLIRQVNAAKTPHMRRQRIERIAKALVGRTTAARAINS